jgi:Zn-dependent peptidase ImmA (M78 family)
MAYALCRTTDQYYNMLVENCERQRIIVFKNGIVKSITKRPLSLQEFRGFVLIDDYAPAIFINSKDSKSAWVFTLAHELAHIWLNIDGIIGDTINKPSDPVELTCNKIAAEFLVPYTCFMENWRQLSGDINSLSKIYKVSNLVIAKRAYDLDLIDQDRYEFYFKIAYQNKDNTGAPSPYILYPLRNSRTVTKHMTHQAAIGNLPLRDAARMLNIAPKTVLELSKRLESV